MSHFVGSAQPDYPEWEFWLTLKVFLPYRVPQVGKTESGACTCLPGQGLRYLEHLCLVLEQMARLQQLYLQLQTQRPSRVSGGQVQVARSVREASRGRVGPLEP